MTNTDEVPVVVWLAQAKCRSLFDHDWCRAFDDMTNIGEVLVVARNDVLRATTPGAEKGAVTAIH